jgi:hypothetical protein
LALGAAADTVGFEVLAAASTFGAGVESGTRFSGAHAVSTMVALMVSARLCLSRDCSIGILRIINIKQAT